MTLEEQIKSVEREIGMRDRVYPAWVRGGKMKQEKAEHETAAMRAVLKTLLELRDGHRAFALSAGGKCSTCGFAYFAHEGHIIPCPRCAAEAMQRRAEAAEQSATEQPAVAAAPPCATRAWPFAKGGMP